MVKRARAINTRFLAYNELYKNCVMSNKVSIAIIFFKKNTIIKFGLIIFVFELYRVRRETRHKRAQGGSPVKK